MILLFGLQRLRKMGRRLFLVALGKSKDPNSRPQALQQTGRIDNIEGRGGR